MGDVDGVTTSFCRDFSVLRREGVGSDWAHSGSKKEIKRKEGGQKRTKGDS